MSTWKVNGLRKKYTKLRSLESILLKYFAFKMFPVGKYSFAVIEMFCGKMWILIQCFDILSRRIKMKKMSFWTDFFGFKMFYTKRIPWWLVKWFHLSGKRWIFLVPIWKFKGCHLLKVFSISVFCSHSEWRVILKCYTFPVKKNSCIWIVF